MRYIQSDTWRPCIWESTLVSSRNLCDNIKKGSYNEVMFNWLMIWFSGTLTWSRYWAFEFGRVWATFWPAGKVVQLCHNVEDIMTAGYIGLAVTGGPMALLPPNHSPYVFTPFCLIKFWGSGPFVDTHGRWARNFGLWVEPSSDTPSLKALPPPPSLVPMVIASLQPQPVNSATCYSW
jgi:hypothetical protein